MMIKLQAKDIVFGYTSNPILDNVNFEIAPSKLVTIVGPNGSGKSTLIKCMDRIVSPQGGSILIDRKDVTKMSRMDMARYLSYVPQSLVRIFPTMSLTPYSWAEGPISDGWEVTRTRRRSGMF
jgi:iron complex transport system ATP-binding protein